MRIGVHCFNRENEDTMNNLRNAYFALTTKQLQTLRSKKVVMRNHLRSQPKTYYNLQDIRKLNQQIDWIDAILRSREDQMELL